MYKANGTKILFVHRDGETEIRATCANAAWAAELLNRAGVMNDVKRKYSAAARLIAHAETLHDFAWKD